MENTCGWSPMIFNALHMGTSDHKRSNGIDELTATKYVITANFRMASNPNGIDRLAPNAYGNLWAPTS